FDALGAAGPRVPAVVRRDAEAAECLARVAPDAAAVGVPGQVAGEAVGGSAGALDLVDGVGDPALVDVGHGHRRALSREEDGPRAPDARGGSGDQRGLALEPHTFVSLATFSREATSSCLGACRV